MFFHKRPKSKEQIENEQRVLWIHEHVTYMTYVDEVEVGEEQIRIAGPHSVGTIEDQMEVLALDCNGISLGTLRIGGHEMKRQGYMQQSIYTGEYVELTAECLEGTGEDMRRCSMLVNKNLFEKEIKG